MEFGNDKYRLLIKNLPDAFAYHQIITDSGGNPVDYVFLDVNPAFEEITGLTREKIIGKKVTQILPGISDSGFDWIGTYGKVALTGESICFEQYSEPLDRWYEIASYSDEPGLFVVIFRGIAKNKKAEDALKFQNIILRTQQEVSLNGILVVDEHDKIISFNQRFADIWEIPGDIMASQSGDKALNFVLPKLVNPEEFANRINYLYENKHEHSYEEIALADRRILERYSAPMFSHDEHYYGRVWYYQDITERKQAEQKLANSNLELEKIYLQLDQELDKARSIHERTLPKDIPEIEGLSMHAYYQPAQRMGGDYYNTIQVNNKVVFYLSDVSGHGMEGTLLSAFVKATIDSYVILKPDEINPEKILRHLSRQYYREDFPKDYFICVFLMVLDLNIMELSYTGLGFQELPFVQMGNGKKMRLKTEGPPISNAIAEELMDFTTGKITLTPGTTVLVSTDGITEQQIGTKQYNARLGDIFYEYSHLPPEIIMSAIKEDFYYSNGESLQGDDDITIGIIQAKPKDKQELYVELESNFNVLPSIRQTVLDFIPNNETAELLLIGLHELVINAIEHGNKFDLQKKVKIEINITGKYVYASVKDEGEGFDWLSKKNKPLELDNNNERGRGIAMTQMCGGELFYNENGNQAFFVFTYSKEVMIKDEN